MMAALDESRAAKALALLAPEEQALLAADSVTCLVCGADAQAAILGCLETMDACIDLHGFPGIPCTLEARRVPGTDTPREA
jgi:hypothetical protein